MMDYPQYKGSSGKILTVKLQIEGVEPALNDFHGSQNTTLVKTLQRKLKSSPCRYPEDHGEDLAQIVWMSVKRNFEKIRDGKSDPIISPEPWLKTIGHNLFLNHIKKCDGRNIIYLEDFESELSSDRTNPETAAQTKEHLEIVYKILGEMDPEMRIILLLHLREGFTHNEIAKKFLEITEVNARKKYSLALRELKGRLKIGGYVQ